MTPDKGPRQAVDAARNAGVPLRIAAKMREPAEQEFFDAVIRPVLGADIEYIGEVGEDDKADFLGGARALLDPIQCPSRSAW
jgi:hypothetical protein